MANTNSKTIGENKMEITNYQPTQNEMKDILISKIKHYKNVDIKIKEVTNAVGIFYAITTYIKLDEISNGVFHSATLKTVSYNKRTVNIKCVFSDNENLIRDMEINRDSVFQCFRDIAPDTITTISLEKFNDQSDKTHVRIIASTIKGSSLIYIYKRLMDFVNVINEKYGNLVTTPIKDIPINNIIEPVEIKKTIVPIVSIVEEIKKVEKIEKVEKVEEIKKQVTKPIISSFALSDQIIKDLEVEEVRLQAILDNIRLLKQTQLKCLEHTNTIKIHSVTPVNINANANANASASVVENAGTDTATSIPPTFASKVKNSSKQ